MTYINVLDQEIYKCSFIVFLVFLYQQRALVVYSDVNVEVFLLILKDFDEILSLTVSKI